MRKSSIAAAAAGALLVTGFAAPAFADGHDNAQLSVLHAVPGLDVDVYVNGEPTLPGFTPSELAGPLELPADSYLVEIREADEPAGDPPILSATLPLEAGMNYTAVAHLEEDGTPTLSLFTNDISETAAGEGRVTVRHVAAAPAVDILAGDTALFEDVSNPDEGVIDVPVDTYPVSVNLAGTDTTVLSGDVPVEAGVNIIVYAWGSAEAETLDLAIQTVSVLSGSPDGIPSGTQGLAASGSSNALIVAMLLGLAALGVTARVVAVRR